MDNNLFIAAFSSLAIGLLIYAWISLRGNIEYFYTTNIICWLLIALFPVLLIFSFFPESSISGTVKGVSVGGAIGAFIFIWVYGTKISIDANHVDSRIFNINRKLLEKESELRSLQKSAEKKLNICEDPVPPIQASEFMYFRFKHSRDKLIGIVTGDIRNVKCVDVWVNSENTNMQMARYYESSISGIIRYCGAQKDNLGYVVDDIIHRELMNCLSGRPSVHPATVIATGSGCSRNENNVKTILHVASVQGEVGHGYRPINDIRRCIINSLSKVDSEEFNDLNLSSILFPLMGTGRANGDVYEISRSLIETAIQYVSSNKDTCLKNILFLAWTTHELEACLTVMENSNKLTRVKQI